MKNFSVSLLLFLVLNWEGNSQTFTQITDASVVINQIGGTKEGGAVWADFDNDGDLDVAVNVGASFNSNTFLYRNNGNGTFTNVTSSLIAAIGTGNECCERSIIWGDLNNDGYIDLIGDTHDRIEIYLNRGPSSTPNSFMFGVGGGMTPNQVITSMTDGMNVEGLGLLDYNNDGFLDIVVENDQNGIDIFSNNGTGTPGVAGTIMVQVTEDATGNLGLPAGPHSEADRGDYIATGDYNSDGFLDILARKHGGVRDLYTNNQDGTFSANTTFNGGVAGRSGNKGGVIFCDFDSDGDFDIYWTDAGVNEIWLQLGTNSGSFVASGRPSLIGAGITGTVDIDGCACADVDNDGDTDLFLGNDGRPGDGRETGSFLFINNTTVANDITQLSFAYTNIPANVNAEGVNLVDYDGDGDADIYINVDGANNQLWENDFCDGGGCEFVKVVMEECVDGTTVTKPVVGAKLILRDNLGNIVSAAQDMNSAMGHGAQNPAVVNFGVPDPSATYTLDIIFPAKVIAPSSTPTVESYSFNFVPNTLVDNTLVLTSLNASNGAVCEFSLLPIELLYFKGGVSDEKVVIEWATTSELNNDYFTLEKSADGKLFYQIAQIKGAGTSKETLKYQFDDFSPRFGVNYYRLKQTDYDGTTEYFEPIVVYFDSENLQVNVYPNPYRVADKVNLRLYSPVKSVGNYTIFDINGNEIADETIEIKKGNFDYAIEKMSELAPGIYFLKMKLESKLIGSFKLIKTN